MNVKVNARPKTETAEDNPILFLEEKLEKKGSLEESDLQELFQGARKNQEQLPSLTEFVQDSRKNNNKGGEELGLKKRVFEKIKELVSGKKEVTLRPPNAPGIGPLYPVYEMTERPYGLQNPHLVPSYQGTFAKWDHVGAIKANKPFNKPQRPNSLASSSSEEANPPSSDSSSSEEHRPQVVVHQAQVHRPMYDQMSWAPGQRPN